MFRSCCELDVAEHLLRSLPGVLKRSIGGDARRMAAEVEVGVEVGGGVGGGVREREACQSIAADSGGASSVFASIRFGTRAKRVIKRMSDALASPLRLAHPVSQASLSAPAAAPSLTVLPDLANDEALEALVLITGMAESPGLEAVV